MLRGCVKPEQFRRGSAATDNNCVLVELACQAQCMPVRNPCNQHSAFERPVFAPRNRIDIRDRSTQLLRAMQKVSMSQKILLRAQRN